MAEKHFYEQREFTKKYLLPYFQKHIPNFHKMKVLEVGCAEGGLLDVFLELGMEAAGIELDEKRVETARKKNPHLNIVVGDITDTELLKTISAKFDISKKFDLIIMREVIEHIKNKRAAFDNLDKLLNDGGYLFVSFPPKYSPFAGHQQIGKSFLKMIPYLHLFPKILLKPAANYLNEKEDYIEEIKYHFSTGCTIKEFEMLSMTHNFQYVKKELFLFRPIYSIRFGLPTIKLPDVQLFREFISLGCEALLQKISS